MALVTDAIPPTLPLTRPALSPGRPPQRKRNVSAGDAPDLRSPLLAKSSGDLGKSTEDLERDAMVIAASSMEPTMITGIVTLEDVIEELLGEEIIGT